MTSQRRNQDGPKSELARYAFGYSDKKPSVTFWVIQAVIVVIAIGSIFTVKPPAFAGGASGTAAGFSSPGFTSNAEYNNLHGTMIGYVATAIGAGVGGGPRLVAGARSTLPRVNITDAIRRGKLASQHRRRSPEGGRGRNR